MSAPVVKAELPARDKLLFDGGRAPLIAAGVGAFGLLICVLGLFVDRRQMFHSYLAAYVWVATLPLGALLFLMTGHLMGSLWTIPFRRMTEAVVGAFPAVAVLFVPLAFGLGDLYSWAGAAGPAADDPHVQHLIHHKHAYLRADFFLVRTGIYYALWIGVGWLLCRWSFRQDRDPAVAPGSPRVVSGAAMPAMALTLTFAAFDWLMSLMPQWFSAAFGLYFFAGSAVGGLALVVALAARANRTTLAGALTPSHFHALGKLLFAFVVVWAYIAYSQGFITWIANKPEEVVWFVARVRGSWGPVTLILVLGHFFLPFFLMLPREVKRTPLFLTIGAGWLLAFHYLDIHWMVLPTLRSGFYPHWLDLAALLCVGGLTAAFALWRMRGQPIVPAGDPRLAASMRYTTL
jgi:hypothetical protein